MNEGSGDELEGPRQRQQMLAGVSMNHVVRRWFEPPHTTP